MSRLLFSFLTFFTLLFSQNSVGIGGYSNISSDIRFGPEGMVSECIYLYHKRKHDDKIAFLWGIGYEQKAYNEYNKSVTTYPIGYVGTFDFEYRYYFFNIEHLINYQLVGNVYLKSGLNVGLAFKADQINLTTNERTEIPINEEIADGLDSATRLNTNFLYGISYILPFQSYELELTSLYYQSIFKDDFLGFKASGWRVGMSLLIEL